MKGHLTKPGGHRVRRRWFCDGAEGTETKEGRSELCMLSDIGGRDGRAVGGNDGGAAGKVPGKRYQATD